MSTKSDVHVPFGSSEATINDGKVVAAHIAAGAVLAPKLGIAVINKSGSSIATDKLVAISGLDATSGKPKIVLADADVAAHEDVYVTTAAIANNAEGVVVKSALSAANLNTNSASAAGDPVYLSATAGGFTHTAPTGATARVHPVGMVVVKHAATGQIQWNIGPVRKVGTNELQDDAVATAKIPDNAVTTAKIPDNAVTTAKIADDAVATAKIPDNAIATAKIADDAVTKAKLAAGTGTKMALINGGAAGDHTVTGIATGDEIIFVGHFETAASIATLADLTGEFSISAADTINNAAGTDTTNDQLLVVYNDLT